MPTDPTFETQGPMRVFFTNNTDNGGTNGFPLDVNSPSYSFFGPYMQSQQAALTYGPPGTPPPPWTRGTDWDVIASKSVAPVNFPVVAGGQYGYSAGNAEVLRISDRSPSKVALGGQYTFDLPFGIIATHLSIHLIVTGVAGGSTVLPGFGLWNLGSNPHAWTYLTPTAFDGTWSTRSGCRARSSEATPPSVRTDRTSPTTTPRTFTSEPGVSWLPTESVSSVTCTAGVNAFS